MENVCRHVVLARVVRSLTADKPKIGFAVAIVAAVFKTPPKKELP